MFATSPQFRPYLGGQIPQQIPPQQLAPQAAPGIGQSPFLQQLLQNPALLARLQQLQGTGLGGIQAQPSPYGFGRIGTQPIASSAYSLR